MNSPATSPHLIWKEYRTQRSLWMAILLMAVLFALLLQLVRLFSAASDASSAMYTFFVLGFPPLFALSAACILFAGEHEQETFSFLHAQPVLVRQVFTAKLLTAMAGTFLLIPPLLLLDLWLSSNLFQNPYLEWTSWANMMLTGFELLAWGVLCSLLLRRVLQALIAAAAAETAVVLGVFFTIERLFPLLSLSSTQLAATLIPRLLVALGVLGVAVWLGRRWFDEPGIARQRGGSDSITASWIARWAPGSQSLGQLLWHAWRQSAWLIVGTLAFFMLLSFFVRTSWLLHPSQLPEWHVTAFFLLVPLSGWAGLLTFLPDQASRRYPFFAERAVRPGAIWWSRQLASLTLPLIWLLLTVLTGAWSFASNSSPSWWPADLSDKQSIQWMLTGVLWASLLMYCIGQTASLLVRSPVLSIAIGLFASLVSIGVFHSLIMLGVPGRIWVPLLAIALLAATRWSIRAWTEQIQTWSECCRKAALVAVPLLAAAAIICAYRAYEIPRVSVPSLDHLRAAPSAGQAEAARMYVELFRELLVLPVDDPDVRRVGQLLVAASQHDEAWFPPLHAIRPTTRLSQEEINLLRTAFTSSFGLERTALENTRRSIQDGSVDEALSYPVALFHTAEKWIRFADAKQVPNVIRLEMVAADSLAEWAASDSVTLAQIQLASRQVRQIQDSWNLNQVQQREYLWNKDLWSGKLDVLHARGMQVPLDSFEDFRWYVRFVLPMEYARIQRLLDAWLVVYDIEKRHEQYDPDGNTHTTARSAVQDWQIRRWMATTPILPPLSHVVGDFVGQTISNRWQRLALLQVQLAMRAYYLEHDRYPANLEEFWDWVDSSGEFDLDRLSMSSLIYLSEGLDRPIPYSGFDFSDESREIPAGQPLLWVPGPTGRTIEEFMRTPEIVGHTYYPVP